MNSIIVIDSTSESESDDDLTRMIMARPKKKQKPSIESIENDVIDLCDSQEFYPFYQSSTSYKKKPKPKIEDLTEPSKPNQEDDATVARQMQRTENRNARIEQQKRLNAELAENEKTHMGRALLLVQKVLAIVSHTNQVEPIARDIMVDFAQALVVKQTEFSGRDKLITVGYHWTSKANVKKIASNGLMSKAERDGANVQSASHGAVFGDGIYTASQPLEFKNMYGDQVIMLIVAMGKTEYVGRKYGPRSDPSFNTVVGNKNKKDCQFGDAMNEIVLQQSSQVIPVFVADNKVFNSPAGKSDFFRIQAEVGEIIKMLNDPAKYLNMPDNHVVSFAPPPQQQQQMQMQQQVQQLQQQQGPSGFIGSLVGAGGFGGGGFAAIQQQIQQLQQQQVAQMQMQQILPPPSLMMMGQSGPPARKKITAKRKRGSLAPFSPSQNFPTLKYKMPTSLAASNLTLKRAKTTEIGETDECSICLEHLTSGNVRKMKCGHMFHFECITLAVKSSTSCPCCRVPFSDVVGSCPSDILEISTFPMDLTGEGCGAYQLSFKLKSGTQQAFHPTPGKKFAGTTRVAYFPATKEFVLVLQRIKWAFMHGLAFTIGTSMTTGAAGVITYSRSYFKTSPSGGAAAHSFPDPGYLVNISGELDSLSVPKDPQELDANVLGSSLLEYYL
ncbi:hypothetical protein ScalyP_jg4078 [Parmales sp. scaly parma]|nr:hypothetical protein ScalyP_jg4078 [Parmales sp. scaly parma]